MVQGNDHSNLVDRARKESMAWAMPESTAGQHKGMNERSAICGHGQVLPSHTATKKRGQTFFRGENGSTMV